MQTAVILLTGAAVVTDNLLEDASLVMLSLITALLTPIGQEPTFGESVVLGFMVFVPVSAARDSLLVF